MTQTTKENRHGYIVLDLLIKKAEAGDTYALYKLADILASGSTGEQNHEDSFYWYMKAALKGHAKSMWNAGLQLIHGLGVERTVEAGLHMIHLAANRYNLDAIHFLRDAYRFGLYGIPMDRKKGDYWHRIAEQEKRIFYSDETELPGDI